MLVVAVGSLWSSSFCDPHTRGPWRPENIKKISSSRKPLGTTPKKKKKKKKLWVSGHATDSYWSPGFKRYQRNGFFCGPFTDIENGRMTPKKKKGSGVWQNRNKCPFCLNGMTPGEDELSAHFAASNKFRRVWIGRRDITKKFGHKNYFLFKILISIIHYGKFWT